MLRCRDPQLRAAVAIAASQLAFPYGYYYDLMALSAPLAVLARDGLRTGWLRGEREALAVLWIGPLPLLLALEWADISLGVAFPTLALALLLRRASRHEGG
jgi:apolipoprotein N-acyltransferase